MANFIKHIPCPVCGSRDNRGIWDDGSEYCFGCKDYTPGNRGSRPQEPPEKKVTPPPTDLVSELPGPFLAYYRGFGLTEEEIKQYFTYSPSLDRTVFQRGDYWEARSLDKLPKTLSHGEKPMVLIGRSKTFKVCIVEDLVSAIKVGRQVVAIPLFGSSLKLDWLLSIPGLFATCFIWLDYNMLRGAIDIYRKLQLTGVSTRIIRTEQDPKYYSDDEIKSYLNLAQEEFLKLGPTG